MQADFLLRWTGAPIGAAYTHYYHTPLRETSPTMEGGAAVDMEKDEFGRKTKRPKYRRRTTSMAPPSN